MKPVFEASFSNNTILYRGYFKEILNELEKSLENIYRIRIISCYTGLNCHSDGLYYRYHIPIHRAKNFYFNLQVNDKIENIILKMADYIIFMVNKGIQQLI